MQPAQFGQLRFNLPNLAILVWRLAAYRVTHSWPVVQSIQPTGLVSPDASYAARFFVHPAGSRLVLFNDFHYDPDARPPEVTHLDGVPGPIHPARLTSGAPFGAPERYVGITTWASPPPPPLSDLGLGLELQLPDADFAPFDPTQWKFRGANLCAWEAGLKPPLQEREVAIDPRIGRIVIGCRNQLEANALQVDLRVTYTYGAVGPVGAHPTSARGAAPATFADQPTQITTVDSTGATPTLAQALGDAATPGPPLVIEIADSATYVLDPTNVPNMMIEDGGPNILLARPLIVRAAAEQRPIIELELPLRFRPQAVFNPDPTVQAQLDARNRGLTVVLEALYLTPAPTFIATDALIARAAVHALEIKESTLDPGGEQLLDPLVFDTKLRGPTHVAMRLADGYGFSDPNEAGAFKERPSIALWRSIAGSLLVDPDQYMLGLTDSIIDAAGDYAISGAGPNPAAVWGVDCTIDCVTIFGRTRVNTIEGRGGIFTGRLEAFNNQTGCLKYCWFSGDGDRLPQNYACVRAPDAFLDFKSDRFGNPAYGQLTLTTDRRVLEQ